MIRYAKPRTLDEALALLGEARWRILAGCTDFYPALGNRPLTENVLDINGLDALRGFSETQSHLVIGARTTWSAIVAEPLPAAFDALKQAAREVGSVQIQNVATIAGNLCNASPAADGVPALMALDAEVELASLAGRRLLPLGDFILGNRRTALAPGEMLTAIHVPRASTGGASCFHKLGARRYLVISIAMAAARLAVAADGTIAKAAVAVGACSAVAQRLPALEAALVGLPAGPEVERAVEAADLSDLSPIDDVRASADYRRAAAREIVQRALAGAFPGSATQVAA
ncbi:xanthine dehydrogenase family protein subunit M [Mesorhizobium sp. ZMM04-5]|uniref:Xanthine dehydrogenase family protein subunit M n=1 Tax=Mesorhizobium marinum TaxID=3228790 RepID=A0ABV3R2M9_9HYPH